MYVCMPIEMNQKKLQKKSQIDGRWTGDADIQ